MKINENEIEINGIKYVPKSEIKNISEIDGKPVMMVRTYSAGVFFGVIKERNGKEGIILNARRVWSWTGAASLSQLATSGTSNPMGCKFPEPVAEVILTEIIEIIPITEAALKTLNLVPIWKQ